MLSATNFWMCTAGVVYLLVGAFLARKEIGAARGWDKLVALGAVFIAASLAAFAPEHFKGPEYIGQMAPHWMPVRAIWPYVIGCALFAAATSLALRKFERLSSFLLGLMFFIFVCTIYLPSALRHPTARFAWVFVMRDFSFCAGAWALFARYSRSRRLAIFSRMVLAIAAVVFAVNHFLHPQFAPGVPSEKAMPSWTLFPPLWGYVTGAILLIAGLALALNKMPRKAAASIGALMTVLTIVPYLVLLLGSLAGTSAEVNEAINYVADTLLYAGAALAVASAVGD